MISILLWVGEALQGSGEGHQLGSLPAFVGLHPGSVISSSENLAKVLCSLSVPQFPPLKNVNGNSICPIELHCRLRRYYKGST